MRDERFRRFRPFRDFARSRKAETALAARFFSRFRDFDGKSKSADGRIQGHPRRRLFGGLVNATPLTGARFFRDFEIPFSTKTESRNLRVQSFGGARRRSTGNLCFVLPHPPTQLDTSRVFEISTKSGRWGQPNPGRCPRPRRSGGIVSASLALRCPVGTLLLGRRYPGCGAVRAEAAARQSSASLCSVSRYVWFRGVSTFPDFTRSRTSDVSSLVAARAARLLPGRRGPGRDAIRAGTAARQPSACLCRVSKLRRLRDCSTSSDFTRSRTA